MIDPRIGIRLVVTATLVGMLVGPLPARAQGSPMPADSVIALPGAPAPRPITLAQASALAGKNAPKVIEAQGQERAASSEVHAAVAAFVPTVSLSAGAIRQIPAGSHTRIDPATGQIQTIASAPWAYSTGLGAGVDLFDGGRRFFDLGQARARAAASSANSVTQRYQAVLAAKQQFFNVLAARESEDAARAQLEQAEQQFRVSSAKVRAHTATRSDSLRAEIQVRSARLAVLQATTSLSVANASLTRAVGSSDPVTAAPADTLPPTLAVDDATLARLAETGPVVQGALQTLSAARSAKRGSWTSYLPTVSASYSRGGSGVGDSFSLANDLTYSGSFRLGVSLPVFNQWQREVQVTQASVAEDNARAELADARLAAREALATALGAYHTAEQTVASQEASVAAALEDLRVQQQRYNVGGSTQLDVLTSQTQLDQARRDLIRARYDQRVAKAQLEALVGRDL